MTKRNLLKLNKYTKKLKKKLKIYSSNIFFFNSLEFFALNGVYTR